LQGVLLNHIASRGGVGIDAQFWIGDASVIRLQCVKISATAYSFIICEHESAENVELKPTSCNP